MVVLKIKDKKTGHISDGIDIMDLIDGQYIEFNFPDGTTIPYRDFLYYREDFEANLEVE